MPFQSQMKCTHFSVQKILINLLVINQKSLMKVISSTLLYSVLIKEAAVIEAFTIDTLSIWGEGVFIGFSDKL